MKKVTFEHKSIMNIYKTRKYVLALALLLTGGIAKAQVTVHGNVYGGGNIGEVVKTTDGTGNTSVIVNGGTIGDTLRLKHRVADKQMQVTTRVNYGNVYGGGNGYLITGHNPNNNAPTFDINAGRVQGNTSVYVGGDAVVRRAVYGGGNMASVGMYSADNGVATYTSGGHTVVTVTGNALIGPKKTDLTSPTPAELDSVKEFYNMTSLMSASQYADSAFKYLGANEGWVFGSSRGISGGALRDYSFVDTTEVTISGNAQVLNVFGSGENGHVKKGTNVIVKDNALIGGVPLHGAGEYQVPASEIADNPGEYSGATYTLAEKDSETAEDEFGVGREIPRGNVLGGGKGTDFISWFANPKYCYTSGRVYGNTHVTVQDNARIYNRVYGGGLIAMVGTFTEEDPSDPDNHTIIGIASGGHTYVNINGGFIGSPGSNGHNCGEVYGGSRGLPGRPRKMVSGVLETLTPLHQMVDEAYVGHTHVTVDGGTVMNSVYGGGANGHVQGNTYVTIKETDSNKRTTIGLEGVGGWHGNVYAGGGGTDRYTEDNAKKFSITAGRVFGNTNLNITGGTIMHNVYGGGALASVGPLPTTDYDPGTSTCTVNINGGTIGQVVTPTSGVPFNYGGNVYGAGRGIIHELAPLTQFASASNAVVNVNNGSGTVIGNVYGGGSYGQVKKTTSVNMIGGSVEGSVFGGGMGIETEEIAGLVKGNATVDMMGGTVKRSVYGGGQMGSVGTYTYSTVTYPSNDPNGNAGKTVQFPTACAENTGLATVTMRGGSVGDHGSLMPWEDHNPDDDDRGWIFCGGQGVADSITYPKAIALGVVNCTHLQISNTTSGENIITPVVTASVYGGAENGLVLDSTFVEIAGGQIGTGLKSKSTVEGELVGTFDGIYTEQNWSTAIAAINNGTIETALGTSGSLHDVFHECDAWEYTTNYLYDIFANATGYESQGGALVGTNGHSFFGNVFGGGSGSYPIAPGVWRPTSGQVNGNTRVEITGGHILTAVYGGNETTDVKGKSTVKMNGGTVGIPRTAERIAANPLNGNIFGAGMGDPRTMFNTMTNVKKTQVYLTGGTVFGNVYGGSREGHVLDSTLVVIGQEQGKSTLIGTTGFSGFDGLVFGGGMGNVDYFDAEGRKFPVGRVGGNTHVRMTDGKVLGSIYGGGLVALGGVNVEGWIDIDSPYDAVNHGRAKVEVSGGVIGNNANGGLDLLLSDQHVGNVFGGGRGSVEEYREDDLGRVGNAVVKISGSPTVYGSVYGGGQMANVGFWDDYDQWYHEGTAFTIVSISGSPTIGTQKEFDPAYSSGTGTFTPKWTFYDVINGVKMINHTLTGNVFGGGKGDVKLDEDGYVVGLEHGHCGSSEVSISGTPTIRSSVFGGSERGAVWGDAKVNITGGTIGTVVTGTDQQQSTYNFGSVFGGSYGADAYQHFDMNPSNQTLEYLQKVDSVNLLAGRVYGNTSVDITGGVVRGNVFGGGDMASVGEWDNNFVPKDNTGKATVNVSGSAIVGLLDGTGLNAYVFGGGKGIGNDPDNLRKKYCNVNETEVTVNLTTTGSITIIPENWVPATHGGRIWGSIFGGAANGHILCDTKVKLQGGLIGTTGLSGIDGHVYGGGQGNTTNTEFTAGRVCGNTNVEISDGNILGCVFGGGRMALTGVDVNGSFSTFVDNNNVYDTIHHGTTHVEITGGVIGNNNNNGNDLLTSDQVSGNVYGAGRGDPDEHQEDDWGRVAKSVLSISGSPTIYGSVYGGGQMANVGHWLDYAGWYANGTSATTVNITGSPTIGTEREFSQAYASTNPTKTLYETINGRKMLVHTRTGNVYGSGQGDVKLKPNGFPEGFEQGHCGKTFVNISETPTIMGSVFGGAEQGAVWGNTRVDISGGVIGTMANNDDDTGENANLANNHYFGSVFGGSYGKDAYIHLGMNPNTVLPRTVDSINGLSGRVYGNTYVNITGGAVRGNVFGGGDMASVGEWNNNFVPKDNTGKATVTIGGSAVIGPFDWTGLNASVFGGGKGIGNDPDNLRKKYCNLNSTEVTVSLGENGRVFGSLFGGGSDAHTLGDTHVKLLSGTIGTEGVTSLDGNVFGGGRNFLLLTYAAGRVGGNTSVEMTGGNVLGSVYGGGRNGLTGFSVDLISTGSNTYQALPDNTNDNTYGRTSVKISGGTVGNLAHMKDSEFSIGDVYGGGKGSKTGIEDHHISSALLVSLVKETEVEISGTARIYGNVYGGSELSNVGNFTWKQEGNAVSEIAFVESTGHTKVTVSGGTIGMDNMKMITASGYPDDWGHVFGGCEGWVEELTDDDIIDQEGHHLVELMATAVSTEVEISNNAFVLGSVYGGAENGLVIGNTLVKIQGGQIGAGEGIVDAEGHNRPYTDDEWANSATLTPTAHWNYVEDGLPYDINIKVGDKPKPGLNGATFYGNVFGGGSGYYPYGTVDGQSQWLRTAGQVWGNTRVEVTGGHILSCLYGGCETTNIGGYEYNETIHGENHVSGGQSTIVMTDGTIGVPRTSDQITKLPVPGYLYGSGKGDPRLYFNTWTNVWSSDVAVSGGRIYGSVFGGGEDGHVMGDVNLSISETDPNTPTIIGCGGFTPFDGNVFGSGRGTTTLALTAGSVSGNVYLTVTGGTIHNSVYGGGNRGSVGTYLVDKFVGQEINPHYGQMRPDDGENNTYGYTYVTIGSADQQSNIEIGHSAVDEHDLGGNVYGGGRGDAGPPESDFPNMAKVKQTTVNIRQQSGKQTWIEGSVFGSGEDGHVLQNTYVNIYDGQIGGHHYGDLEPCNDPYHGNVYGGGRGVDTYEDPEHPGTFVYSTTAGWVQGNTNVNMYGGHVVRNVYGGGNLASVGDPEEEPTGGNYLTGLASVTITGGTVGTIHENENFGNVFGSSHGGSGSDYVHLAYVKNTHVTIGQTARIYGSVFGGGEDGHVRMNAIVDIEGGIIGDEDDVANQPLDGNVYGGGRGLLLNGNSESAGEVYGYTTVNIKNSTDNGTDYSPEIWNNVFGGGSQSVVQQYKVVNMSGGLVHGSVFGGSREIPTQRPNKAPRWVNMWGGTVEGNVYGCSYLGTDGDPDHPTDFASFVNISGGTIGIEANGDIEGGNVYGAGYGGKVKGSVAVLIGKNAIVETSSEGGEFHNINIHRQETPVIANLDIKGSVFGGSFGTGGSTEWDHSFNVTGYSRVYIDGTDYNTTDEIPDPSDNDYMYIRDGVYGCGTNCESGEKGRNILVRNYGTRNPEGDPDAELTKASRTLTTIQRGDIVLLDNTNVNLSGAADISQSDSDRAFAVLQVDKGVYVTNASGIVLGAVGAPAYMDSIFEVRSLHLMNNSTTSYLHMNAGSDESWEWIGVNPLVEHGITQENTQENARLYYTQTASSTPLDYNQENVIIFNGDSRLYVRYLDKTGGNKKRMYGQLQGFFRMRSPFSPRGTESFAYARPKLTQKNNTIDINGDNSPDYGNEGDGGFLSYDNGNNFFTQPEKVLYYTYTTDGDDGGNIYTKTKQYPYFNIGEYVLNRESSEMDMEEFREWVLPTISGKIWYVDGRGIGHGGWGKDDYHQLKWGHFPDMPKETITGDMGIYNDINDNSHEHKYEDFSPADDIIYVVGPVEAIKEKENLNKWPQYQLKLYRYPGRHMMSNDQYDETVVVDAEHPAIAPDDEAAWNGQTQNSTVGPGANLGMMIHANKTAGNGLVLENVLVDGLFTYSNDEITALSIPPTYTNGQKYKVNKPMVVTTENAKLTLKSSQITLDNDETVTYPTILQRGYNGIDVSTITITQDDVNYTFDNFYPNPDFNGTVTVTTQGDTPTSTDYTIYNGGALFVDEDATVNVEGFVTITGNKQRHMDGSEDETVDCNVYLPTFSKSLTITGALTAEDNAKTLIGITSPIRNKADHYKKNTFSPVAVAHKAVLLEGENQDSADKMLAFNAWTNNNFYDDQNWFFVRDCIGEECGDNTERTTYYCTYSEYDQNIVNKKTLYFGWTWANVVRKQPVNGYLSEDVNDFSYQSIDSPEDLAWLISVVNGENEQTASSLETASIKQTADIDLIKYVWVPIGSEPDSKEGDHPFGGMYDGQGHLITNLSIEYIGKSDHHYERSNYGLFGMVDNGKINRTFVLNGLIKPESVPISGGKDGDNAYNIGGLVGTLQGENALVSNSEAAVDIHCPNNTLAGGLVGQMLQSKIHSSMAMSNFDANATQTIGGLVGDATGTIYNSFANPEFGFTDNTIKAGGLVGNFKGTSEMSNCYVALRTSDGLSNSNFGSIAAQKSTVSSISNCYTMKSNVFHFTIAGDDDCDASCVQYEPVISADELGYMYADNRVATTVGQNPMDTTMFLVLNKWVDDNNHNGHTYARWARPGLQEINDDLPVLLIDNYSNDANAYIGQGDFRSVGTYAGGPALQYGGTVRDGDALNSALTRPLEKKKIDDETEEDIPDYLFVYGDVDEVGGDLAITQSKVSIHEDVSILHAGSLADYGNNYVGITFDNSCGKATSTPGVNYGLNGLGMGGYPLPRDWHMFSTPLQMAPLGFEYYLNADYSSDENNTNRNTYSSGYVGTYYNNIWTNPSTEFSWLNNGVSGDNRYWMKGWVNSQSPRNSSSFDENKWVDGYFPSQYRDRFGEGCIENTDEWGRYPYGMDFYTWTEPDYHWINFKRNGPNHWHTDTRGEDDHWHLDYKPYGVVTIDYPANVNENNLIVGRGYMASIGTETFMQSHGKLNKDISQSDAGNDAGLGILLTNTSESKLPGWNLVGNPYHGYLDFNLVGTANSSVLGTVNINTNEGSQDVPFYVIYDADKYNEQSGKASTAFRYYPVTSSRNGEYADRYLHPHQGFYVKAKSGGGTLKFTEDMLVSRADVGTGGDFRDERPAYPLVNLYLSSDKGCADVTVIEFNRPEWGGARKLKELRVGDGLFYGHHDGTYYAALFAEEGVERVPLWFEAKDDDIFTIKWNTANGDFHSMYLIDNIAGVQYDMLRNDTYSFEGHKGDYPSRFYIVFDVTGVDEFDEGDHNFVFFDGSQWVVTGDGLLEFIDVHGRVLWQKTVSGQSRVGLPNVACGMYLMRLTNNEGTRVQKVIIDKK